MRQLLFRSTIVAAAMGALVAVAAAIAENVDPDVNGSQYAWGENVGWINAEPANSDTPIPQGLMSGGLAVTGYMWGENIGWINMSCQNNGTCASTGNYGVTNDNLGNLAGYAWGENVGWISFSCANTNSCGTVNYGVDIDPATGEWTGFAWGENIGWINFSHAQAANRIQTGDGDGIDAVNDNCDFDNNPAQTNTDAANTGLGFPGADVFGDACDVDDDGDGCSDAEELQTAPLSWLSGGQRDPLLLYDIYDVNGTKNVNAADIGLVRSKFTGIQPTPPGDVMFDRRVGAQNWAPGAPNGVINATDIGLVRASFNTNCIPAP
jgi:hypothetical protein